MIVLTSMSVITTVTQKGQVTLPKGLREGVGIKKLGRVRIEQEKKFLKIIPTHDILDIAGTFKPKRGKSVMKARKALERDFTP